MQPYVVLYYVLLDDEGIPYPDLEDEPWLRKSRGGTAVVVDVGISTLIGRKGERKIVGDVTFDEVSKVAGVLTPVPGGVGPVTVAILLRSAAEAASKQLATPRRLES